MNMRNYGKTKIFTDEGLLFEKFEKSKEGPMTFAEKA